MIEKVCKVHGVLDLTNIYVRYKTGTRDVRQYECEVCRKEGRRKSYENNKDSWNERAKKWAKDNKEKIQEYDRNRRKEKPEYWVKNRKRTKENAVKNLSSSYIRNLFRSQGYKAKIPVEIIELKRIVLKLKRLIKERKNG